MGHLKHFGIKNFRVFGDDSDKISFKPITLFTGANNAGKSSIIKALLLVKASFEQSKTPVLHQLDFRNGVHDLGKFGDVLSNKDSEHITIELPCSFLGLTNQDFSLVLEYKTGANREEKGERELRDTGDYARFLHSFSLVHYLEDGNRTELLAIGPVVYYTKPEPDEPGYRDMDAIYCSFTYTLNIPPLINLIRLRIGELEKEIESDKKGGLYGAVFNIEQKKEKMELLDDDVFVSDKPQWLQKLETFETALNELGNEKVERSESISNQDYYYLEEGLRHDIHGTSLDYFLTLPWIKHLATEIENAFSVVRDTFRESLFHLTTYHGKASRLYFNDGSPFNDAVQKYVDYKNKNGGHHPHQGHINWCIGLLGITPWKELKVTSHDEFGFNRVLLTNGDKENCRETYLIDLGYGVTKILSIVLQTMAHVMEKAIHYPDDTPESRPSVIILEEPESNLHPDWQSKLAKMISKAALDFKVQFIIETHSEYFIRSLQNDVAEGLIPNDAIQIYYFNRDVDVNAENPKIKSIDMGRDGAIDYRSFGKGFFDERNELELNLLNINRRKFIDDYHEITQENQDLEIRIAGLNERVDEYVQEKDISRYEEQLRYRLGDNHAKLQVDAFRFLTISMYFKDSMPENFQDFAPALGQAGRTVEAVLKEYFSMFASRVNQNNCNEFASKNDDLAHQYSGGDKGAIKCFTKNCWIKYVSNPNKFPKFHDMIAMLRVVEILPTSHSQHGDVLAMQFKSYHVGKMIQQTLLTSNSNNLFCKLDRIRDRRNKASHPPQNGNYMSKEDAENMINDTIDFLKAWCDNLK